MAQTTRWGGKRVAAALMGVAALTALTSAATRGPDPAGYTATDAAVYSFIDLAGGGGGAAVLDDTDDGTVALTLPFAFEFYGVARSLLCVSANGAAYFVSDLPACSGIADFANTDLSVTSTPGDTPGLFPLWSDLTFDQAGAGSVLYQTQGAAGSRQFIVQWHNAYPSGSATPVTFQMILREGTNQVLFQYKTVDLGPENAATKGANATVGIRNSEALVSGQQIQWSYAVPVIANESAILFSAPSASQVSGKGTIRPPNSGHDATFAMDVKASPQGGSLTFFDPVRKFTFIATSVTGVKISGKSATFTGNGTVNGAAGYTFVVTATDTPDQFGIQIRRVNVVNNFYNLPLKPISTGAVTVQ